MNDHQITHTDSKYRSQARVKGFAGHQRPRAVAPHQPGPSYSHPEGIPGPPVAYHNGRQVVDTQDIPIQATQVAYFIPSSPSPDRTKDVYAYSRNPNPELTFQASPAAINNSGGQTGAPQSFNFGNSRTGIWCPRPLNPSLYGTEAWSLRLANFTNSTLTRTTTATSLPENVGPRPGKRAATDDLRPDPEGNQEAEGCAKRPRPN
ncbi:hypothetical protein EYC84_011573 [Monilinia fructicola]|uniref:Uncharacterized protein n=1 Tax=Monilinia fructicola TaxID=38448 RepID=A0A5M9JAI5_MONFR|nr:hypothetical protein EYC84_011573 [Monilinia fructicola]